MTFCNCKVCDAQLILMFEPIRMIGHALKNHPAHVGQTRFVGEDCFNLTHKYKQHLYQSCWNFARPECAWGFDNFFPHVRLVAKRDQQLLEHFFLQPGASNLSESQPKLVKPAVSSLTFSAPFFGTQCLWNKHHGRAGALWRFQYHLYRLRKIRTMSRQYDVSSNLQPAYLITERKILFRASKCTGELTNCNWQMRIEFKKKTR